MEKGVLVLLRHGASAWNQRNLFTGWVDIPLSEKGVEESIRAGEKMKGVRVDLIFTSELIRAQMTAMLAMMGREKVPCFVKGEEQVDETLVIPTRAAWELNERKYGELQGLNKDVAREKFGKEQVHRWRRSFREAPPGGESLQMTSERAVPYFEREVVPCVDEGKNVLVCAHGNSLRSIVMKLEGLSEEEVVGLEIPTGEPWVYRWDKEWKREED